MSKKKKKKTESPVPGSPVGQSGGQDGEGAGKAAAKPIPTVSAPQTEPKSKESKNVDKATLLKQAQEGKKPKHTEEIGTTFSWKNTLKFLKDVQLEARKITWPDRAQIIQETWTVLILVTFITFLVLGYDFVLGKFIFGPIEHVAKMNAKPDDKPSFTVTPGAPTQPGFPDVPGPIPTVPIDAPPGAPTTPGGTGTTPAVPGAPVVPGATTPGAPATAPGAPTTPGAPATAPGAPTTPGAPATAPGAPAGTAPPASTTTPAGTTPGAATPVAPAPVAPQSAAPGTTPAPAAAPATTTPAPGTPGSKP